MLIAPFAEIYTSKASFLNNEEPLIAIDCPIQQPLDPLRYSLVYDIDIAILDGAYFFFQDGAHRADNGQLFYSLEPSNDQLATWELARSGASPQDVLIFDGHNWVPGALPGLNTEPDLHSEPGQPYGFATLNAAGQLDYAQIFVLQHTGRGRTSDSVTLENLPANMTVRDAVGNLYPASTPLTIPLSSITRLDVCNTEGAVLTSAWVSPGDIWYMNHQ